MRHMTTAKEELRALYLKAEGVSLQRLASLTGVHPSTLSRVLNGPYVVPSHHVAVVVARALGGDAEKISQMCRAEREQRAAHHKITHKETQEQLTAAINRLAAAVEAYTEKVAGPGFEPGT